MKLFSKLAAMALVAGGIMLGGPASSTNAAVVISPNNLANTEGLEDNSWPYDLAEFGQSQTRYQQVYQSGQFSSLGGPQYLVQIAYRPDCQYGEAFDSVLPNIVISVSTTNKPPDGLSTTFANNLGADTTVVHTGPLHLSSAFSGPASGPKAFDIIITLQTPFLYDPSKGNLIVDVKNIGGGRTTTFDADALSLATSRLADGTNNANVLVGSDADTHGLVTKFKFVPVPVPLPASAWGGLALIAILGAKRFRSMRAMQTA